jgi:3'-5' exoribonuclease
LLGHVELGLRLIGEHAPAALDGERRLALEHCVILHHGPEPSSGQRFALPEALALYRLNALDAQVKGVLEHGQAGY